MAFDLVMSSSFLPQQVGLHNAPLTLVWLQLDIALKNNGDKKYM